jgi:hypothetical protein
MPDFQETRCERHVAICLPKLHFLIFYMNLAAVQNSDVTTTLPLTLDTETFRNAGTSASASGLFV